MLGFHHYRDNIVLVAFLCCCACCSTVSFAQLREPFLQHISVEQGLSQSSVYCILQDHKGFLWFGTGDGLDRYDGYEITSYRHSEKDTNSLADNTVRAMMEDRSGILWIATVEALNRYDRATGKYTQIPLYGVEVIYEDKNGRIWLGANAGIFYMNPHSDSVHHFTYPAGSSNGKDQVSVKAFRQDSDGNIWVGTEYDFDKFDPVTGEVHYYASDLSLASIPRDKTIYGFAEGEDKTMWVATGGNGLLKVTPSTGKIEQFMFNPGMSDNANSNYFFSLRFINDTTLWLGSRTDVILSFNTVTHVFSPLFHPAEIRGLFKTKDARYIFLDRSGLAWIGTDGDGIYKYDFHPKKFKHLHADESNPNSLKGNFIRSIFEDSRNRVWIGTYQDGISILDKTSNRFTRYLSDTLTKNTPSSVMFVNAIAADTTGTIWIGTDRGMMKFDEKHRRFIPVFPGKNLNTYTVASMTLSTSGQIWMSMNYRLFLFNPYTSTFKDMEFDLNRFPNIKNNGIENIYEDRQGILWLGTYSGGVNRFNPRTNECTAFTYDKKNRNSLSDDLVKVVYQSNDGIIWIGTEHGLNKYDSTTGTFTRYFEEDGLPNAYIYGILEDARGNLWISTNSGVTRFTPATQKFRNYGVEDGLQSSEFNTGAFFKNRDGEMYFGGINGLNIFHPDSIRDNPHVPSVVLTSFKLLDIPDTLKGEISEIPEIKLSYLDGVFSLRFAALEFTNPRKNHYAYMLEGFEKNWIYYGSRREVRYTHLDPGRYVFHVKACNNDGVWNEAGTTITIIVVPPFWRTWWFLTLAGIFVLGSVGGTIRYFEMRKVRHQLDRLERERAMDRERARISQDMHDEIGANLTKIAIMSEIAQRDMTNRVALEEHLQKISGTARDVVDSISEIVWAINPKNDRLDNLIAFIREYTSAFLEGTDITCHFSIPETIPEYPFSGEHRRNILLVVKEALNNIAKHSKATEVSLNFSIQESKLFIIIQDNGDGFCPEKVSILGNGLFNMKKRMETIQGTWDIHSEQHHGTIVRVSLPLS